MLINLQQSFRSKRMFKKLSKHTILIFFILYGDIKGYILYRMYFSLNVMDFRKRFS